MLSAGRVHRSYRQGSGDASGRSAHCQSTDSQAGSRNLCLSIRKSSGCAGPAGVPLSVSVLHNRELSRQSDRHGQSAAVHSSSLRILGNPSPPVPLAACPGVGRQTPVRPRLEPRTSNSDQPGSSRTSTTTTTTSRHRILAMASLFRPTLLRQAGLARHAFVRPAAPLAAFHTSSRRSLLPPGPRKSCAPHLKRCQVIDRECMLTIYYPEIIHGSGMNSPPSSDVSDLMWPAKVHLIKFENGRDQADKDRQLRRSTAQ